MAITACEAKVFINSICFSVNGAGSRLPTPIAPMASPSRIMGTWRTLFRIPAFT